MEGNRVKMGGKIGNGGTMFVAADYVTGRFWPSRLSFLYMFQSRFGIILKICIYISPAYIKSIFHPTSWSWSWSWSAPLQLHHCRTFVWVLVIYIVWPHVCVRVWLAGWLVGCAAAECARVCVCPSVPVCVWVAKYKPPWQDARGASENFVCCKGQSV